MKKTFKVIKSLLILCAAPCFVVAQQNKVVTKYENQKELTANTSITFSPGVEIKAGAEFRAYISSNAGIPVANTLNTSMNTIATYTMRVPGIIDPADPLNGVNQVNVDVQTMDHFGRVVENQSVKATPDMRDLIQFSKYDNAGRELKKYLPFAYPTGKKNYHGQGSLTPLYNFYYTGNTPKTPSIEWNRDAWHETVFDNSPLNRIKEQGYGDGFTIGSGNTNKFATLMGSADVSKYTVEINATTGSRKLVRVGNNAMYNASDVTISSVKSENVALSDVKGTVLEYKNKEDQVILKRQFNMVGSTLQTLSTYYVYDDLGSLSFVLPPKVEPDASAAIPQTTLDNLCYQYRYDGLNRLISKKVPGKGWEFMVYNKLNQVIMTQDSVQRMKANQEWNVTKYDAQGRIAITGIYVHTGSTTGTSYLTSMQTSMDAHTGGQWETRITTGNGYTNVSLPSSLGTTLSINYYDDYNFPGGNPYPYAGTDASTMTRGLLTGSKVNVLGTSNMLSTVNYYDRDGKVVRTFKQHYKGGTLVATNYDEISSTYDFTGAVLTATRSHKVSGVEQLKVLSEYSYDHRGRKINSWQTINTGARVLLSQVDYDDLGHVYKKKLHSTNNGTSFLSTTTYAYGVRDWVKSTSSSLLSTQFFYQPNGNISVMNYTGKYSGSRNFNYTYDNLNRLTKSVYGTSSGGGDVSRMAGLQSIEEQNLFSAANELSEEIAYDKMGNIVSLKRGASSNTAITYTYANSGMSNRLSSTSGPIAGSFAYDGNGSAISDSRRGVTSIVYNQLNLPQTVTATQSASYVYDASGTKLKSVQGTETREYISGIQYKGGALEFFATEEGRAVRIPADGTYRYEYNLTDHLGNVRVSFQDSLGVASVIQEDEFYAFGLNKNAYTSGTKNNYLYNGKELQTVLTEEYDYGARFYDPVIARWSVIDPLAEMMRRHSPYNYAFNNPINFIDPDGMAPQSWGDYTKSMDQSVGINAGFYQDDKKKKKVEKKEEKKEEPKEEKKDNTALKVASKTSDVAGGVTSGLGATGLTRFGNNGRLYFETPNGGVFTGNQYVSTTSLTKLGSNIVKYARPVGYVLAVGEVGYGIYQDGGSFGSNAKSATAGAIGSMAGAWAGAALGAKAGSAVGSGIGVFFFGAGAAPGAAIGGFVGGFGGGLAGGYFGGEAVKEFLK